MEKTIKTIPLSDGELYAITAGRRLPLAGFCGRVEIKEKTNLVPILGRIQKGTKKIIASFVVCGNLEYSRLVGDDYINSGKVYEALGDIDGERLYFGGLRFEDSNPAENELIFEITDLELIEKLLKN